MARDTLCSKNKALITFSPKKSIHHSRSIHIINTLSHLPYRSLVNGAHFVVSRHKIEDERNRH